MRLEPISRLFIKPGDDSFYEDGSNIDNTIDNKRSYENRLPVVSYKTGPTGDNRALISNKLGFHNRNVTYKRYDDGMILAITSNGSFSYSLDGGNNWFNNVIDSEIYDVFRVSKYTISIGILNSNNTMDYYLSNDFGRSMKSIEFQSDIIDDYIGFSSISKELDYRTKSFQINMTNGIVYKYILENDADNEPVNIISDTVHIHGIAIGTVNGIQKSFVITRPSNISNLYEIREYDLNDISNNRFNGNVLFTINTTNNINGFEYVNGYIYILDNVDMLIYREDGTYVATKTAANGTEDDRASITTIDSLGYLILAQGDNDTFIYNGDSLYKNFYRNDHIYSITLRASNEVSSIGSVIMSSKLDKIDFIDGILLVYYYDGVLAYDNNWLSGDFDNYTDHVYVEYSRVNHSKSPSQFPNRKFYIESNNWLTIMNDRNVCTNTMDGKHWMSYTIGYMNQYTPPRFIRALYQGNSFVTDVVDISPSKKYLMLEGYMINRSLYYDDHLLACPPHGYYPHMHRLGFDDSSDELYYVESSNKKNIFIVNYSWANTTHIDRTIKEFTLMKYPTIALKSFKLDKYYHYKDIKVVNGVIFILFYDRDAIMISENESKDIGFIPNKYSNSPRMDSIVNNSMEYKMVIHNNRAFTTVNNLNNPSAIPFTPNQTSRMRYHGSFSSQYDTIMMPTSQSRLPVVSKNDGTNAQTYGIKISFEQLVDPRSMGNVYRIENKLYFIANLFNKLRIRGSINYRSHILHFDAPSTGVGYVNKTIELDPEGDLVILFIPSLNTIKIKQNSTSVALTGVDLFGHFDTDFTLDNTYVNAVSAVGEPNLNGANFFRINSFEIFKGDIESEDGGHSCLVPDNIRFKHSSITSVIDYNNKFLVGIYGHGLYLTEDFKSYELVNDNKKIIDIVYKHGGYKILTETGLITLDLDLNVIDSVENSNIRFENITVNGINVNDDVETRIVKNGYEYVITTNDVNPSTNTLVVKYPNGRFRTITAQDIQDETRQGLVKWVLKDVNGSLMLRISGDTSVYRLSHGRIVSKIDTPYVVSDLNEFKSYTGSVIFAGGDMHRILASNINTCISDSKFVGINKRYSEFISTGQVLSIFSLQGKISVNKVSKSSGIYKSMDSIGLLIPEIGTPKVFNFNSPDLFDVSFRYISNTETFDLCTPMNSTFREYNGDIYFIGLFDNNSSIYSKFNGPCVMLCKVDYLIDNMIIYNPYQLTATEYITPLGNQDIFDPYININDGIITIKYVRIFNNLYNYYAHTRSYNINLLNKCHHQFDLALFNNDPTFDIEYNGVNNNTPLYLDNESVNKIDSARIKKSIDINRSINTIIGDMNRIGVLRNYSNKDLYTIIGTIIDKYTIIEDMYTKRMRIDIMKPNSHGKLVSNFLNDLTPTETDEVCNIIIQNL